MPLPDTLLRKAPDVPADRLGDGEAEGRPLRLRPDERPRRCDRQGQGDVPRPVPAGRRGAGLGGSPRDVRRPGQRRRLRRPSSGRRRTASTRRSSTTSRTSRPLAVGLGRPVGVRRRRPGAREVVRRRRPRRDPASGRESRPADADRHDRPHRRLRRRLRLPPRRRIECRARPASRSCSSRFGRRPRRAAGGPGAGPVLRGGDARRSSRACSST